MKIVINNTHLPYDFGCSLLKLKHGDTCPIDDIDLQAIWKDIQPLTFKDIAKVQNLEHRRLGILCLGIDRLVKEVEPVLLKTKTLKKTTTWINEKGETVTTSFDDTYKLFKVPGKYFSEGIENGRAEDAFYIECKDTSTDRHYLLWVHPRSVFETNNPEKDAWRDFDIKKVNPVQCVAWTIQTNVKQGNIKRIIRQGDCILIEPKVMGDYLQRPRHITEKEYKKLLVAES